MKMTVSLVSFLTMFAVGCGMQKSKSHDDDATGASIPVEENGDTVKTPPKGEEPASPVKPGHVEQSEKPTAQAPVKGEKPAAQAPVKGEEPTTTPVVGQEPTQGKPGEVTPPAQTEEPGQVGQEQPTQEQPTQNEPSQDNGSVAQQPTQDMPSQDNGSVVQQPTQNEPAQNEPSQNEPSQDNGSVGQQPTQNEPSQNNGGAVQQDSDIQAEIQALLASDGREAVQAKLTEKLDGIAAAVAQLADHAALDDRIAAARATIDNLVAITDDAQFVQMAVMIKKELIKAEQDLAAAGHHE